MCSAHTSSCFYEVLGFTPPVFHDGARISYIDFYVRDKVTGEKKRKKYTVPRHLKGRARQQFVALLSTRIMAKLAEGWSPFGTPEEIRTYPTIVSLFENYLTFVGKMDRKKTIQSYTTRINILKEFIKADGIKMDRYLHSMKKVSGREGILLINDTSRFGLRASSANMRVWPPSASGTLIASSERHDIRVKPSDGSNFAMTKRSKRLLFCLADNRG